MMGTKTLAEIREELRRHFSKDGQDPFEWINKQRG